MTTKTLPIKRNINLQYFSCFLFIQFLIAFYSQTYLLTDDLLRFLIGSQMTQRQFDDYLELVRKWQWVSYLFIPIALLLRISFTWLCLKSGSLILDRFSHIDYWRISIQAEIVFAIGALAGILYGEFFLDVKTIKQLSINPFSLQIFELNLPTYCNYLFNTLNIFELAYVLFLAYLIAEESRKEFLSSLKFVASTYLPGLALWVLLVTYLSVVFQP